MKAKKLRSAFFSVLVLTFSFILVWNGFNFLVSFFSYAAVSPDSHQVLRVILYGSSNTPEGDTVSAKIAVLNRQGDDIAVIERSWPASFLAVDFSTAEFGDKIYSFPEKIYGTNSVIPRHAFFMNRRPGTNLAPYYLENRRCLFGNDEREQKNLYKIANFALSPFSVLITGFSKKYTVNLAACEAGIYYGVFVENGTLALRRE